MSFLFRRNNASTRKALGLYRQCLRVIKQLHPQHQKIWYDYTRLKYEEHARTYDVKTVDKLVQAGYEEVQWVQSVLQRKNSS